MQHILRLNPLAILFFGVKTYHIYDFTHSYHAITLLFSESNKQKTRYALAVQSPNSFSGLVNKASYFSLPKLGWRQTDSTTISVSV
jgi:hypothetical protein